ncbi:hypothetical protein TNCV_4089211 [Trichonephila clavipes]|nr:hypothetical protein TNCV_4089211 [Trichonephila clavipes]
MKQQLQQKKVILEWSSSALSRSASSVFYHEIALSEISRSHENRLPCLTRKSESGAMKELDCCNVADTSIAVQWSGLLCRTASRNQWKTCS